MRGCREGRKGGRRRSELDDPLLPSSILEIEFIYVDPSPQMLEYTIFHSGYLEELLISGWKLNETPCRSPPSTSLPFLAAKHLPSALPPIPNNIQLTPPLQSPSLARPSPRLRLERRRNRLSSCSSSPSSSSRRSHRTCDAVSRRRRQEARGVSCCC